MSDLLEAALEYAAFGWPVFPLHWPIDGKCSCDKVACPTGKRPRVGKHPLTNHGFKDASTDENQIRRWWDMWPNANLAIATGATSNLLVIDCDSEDAIKRFVSQYPEAYLTRQAATGEGLHFYFQWEEQTKSDTGNLLGDKIDIRADRAYIIAPPSLHVGGKRYTWLNDNAIRSLPLTIRETLVNNLNSDHQRFGAASILTDNSDIISEGRRNSTLASLAGRMRSLGMTKQELSTALVAINDQRCNSPLSIEEVKGIAMSISRYPKRENLTDSGNAQLFAAQHSNDVRYCHTWKKWLIWDGTRWCTDHTGQIFGRAKQTVRTFYAAASVATDSDDRKQLAKHASRSESEGSIRAMLSLARNEPGIAITAEQFDREIWKLNVENGTINLHDGKVYSHRREDLNTKLAPVEYDPDASCPNWEEFLNTIMAGNARMIGFLQRAIGYSLTGDVSEQVLFFLYGTGANGKSTFLRTIQEMLGDYAKQAAPNLLVTKRGDSHPTEVADLRGSRFVVVVEVEEGRRMAEALVKQMTGGDKIKSRFMHQDFFEFDPTHKLYLAANHKPVIRGTDYAIWRRIHLVPFNVTINPSQQDRTLLHRLRSESPGILAWAVKGCLEWQQSGLSIPFEVAEATDNYRGEMDVLANFFKECCEESSGQLTQAQELYGAYRKWCNDNGEKYPLEQRGFSTKLKEKGYVSKRGKGGLYYWHNITVKETAKEFAA